MLGLSLRRVCICLQLGSFSNFRSIFAINSALSWRYVWKKTLLGHRSESSEQSVKILNIIFSDSVWNYFDRAAAYCLSHYPDFATGWLIFKSNLTAASLVPSLLINVLNTNILALENNSCQRGVHELSLLSNNRIMWIVFRVWVNILLYWFEIKVCNWIP